MRIELLNVGTELLMGFVVNTHASWLGRRLNGIGATLARQTCVADDAADLRAALSEAMARTDAVITTGGLGPTASDLTRAAIVEALGLETRVDELSLENLHERFRQRGAPVLESVKSQTIVPKTATVFQNAHGTAPGFAIPLNGPCRMILVLPGPPRELRPMFDRQALPLLRKRFADLLPALECRVLRVASLGESRVEEIVRPRLCEVAGLEFGYCARPGEVDLRLVVRAKEAAAARETANRAEALACEALGEAVFGRGDDTLELAVVRLLRERHATLATAESCTGGCLAHRITQVSGSSECFKQGWVTYSNDAKAAQLGVPGHLLVEHGAVSEPVARAMAEGARTRAGTTWALATTGIAGPTGGTPENPAGVVFIALAGPNGTSCARHLFLYERESFKFVATQTALNMLRLEAGKRR
ncbi:MAG: competence/damage-inducible protein A [Verrucomicrobiae bacterium]|nr:competence/damage-inducible protein A [Verrucomicrobiae bacterium]